MLQRVRLTGITDRCIAHSGHTRAVPRPCWRQQRYLRRGPVRTSLVGADVLILSPQQEINRHLYHLCLTSKVHCMDFHVCSLDSDVAVATLKQLTLLALHLGWSACASLIPFWSLYSECVARAILQQHDRRYCPSLHRAQGLADDEIVAAVAAGLREAMVERPLVRGNMYIYIYISIYLCIETRGHCWGSKLEDAAGGLHSSALLGSKELTLLKSTHIIDSVCLRS